jgi:SAM-dependent methyltransferase
VSRLGTSLGRKRLWRSIYRGGRNPTWLEEGPRREVVAAREEGWLPAGASVIDLGCGLAYTSAWLAGLGHEVLGLDRSGDALKRARALHDEPGLTLRRANLTRPLRNVTTYDVVLDLLFLHQLPEAEHAAYADNVRRVSAPGTRLLYVHRLSRAGSPRSTREEKAAYVSELLGPSFELELVQDAEMQANRIDGKQWKGVELRFRRRGGDA